MSVSIERDNHTCIIMCTALEDYIKGDACSREGKILMQSIYNEITEKLKEAD